MRFVAPSRDAIEPCVFARPPLADWRAFGPLLQAREWPAVDALNALRDGDTCERFAAQNRGLLGDGLHYEERIARHGLIATRERNWHDLFNALVWLRYPSLKRALNRRQVDEIAAVGRRRRSRAQCALTHFDEAGVVACVRDARLLALWNAHDWRGLFVRERSAWQDGRIRVAIFGHALLEHALLPEQLLTGKALVVAPASETGMDVALRTCAQAIRDGRVLQDPQELRPLPLAGMHGWHRSDPGESFYLDAACFRPRRTGREYPPPLTIPSGHD